MSAISPRLDCQPRPLQENAARLLAQLAIWTDIGFSGPPLKELLQRFEHLEPGLRSKLSIADYLCIRMVEGMVAMVEEAMEPAIGHFDFVLSLGEELDDRFLLAIAYFWKRRCLRRRGEYDEALVYTLKGKDLAVGLGYPRMAAVMQVLECWLYFQQGKWKESVRSSQAAENVLRETDDYVTLGNIQSFYGRMARREGRFDKAIHFRKRYSLCASGGSASSKAEEQSANMALAKRGIALQLQKRIDREAQQRRKMSASHDLRSVDLQNKDSRKHDYRDRLTQLRREALEHPQAARDIISSVRTITEWAQFTSMQPTFTSMVETFSAPKKKRVSAYELGEEKQDCILMGRAAFWSA